MFIFCFVEYYVLEIKKVNFMKGSDYIKYKFFFKNVKYLIYCNL